MKKIYTAFKLTLLSVFLLFASKNSEASYTYNNVRVPSSVAGTTGLFVRISIPYQTARYSCGAPVVIYMCGGWAAPGILSSMYNMSNYGCIVIQFNYPGGGNGAQKSGGVYDNRGPNSMIAARDVIRYALGQIPDMNNKYLNESTGIHNPLYDNVGIIGGSNGGCNLLSVLGLYHNYLSTVAWVSFFESPIGDGMLTADPGKPYGSTVAINKNNAYNDSTGTYNWNLLKFAPNDTVAKYNKTYIKGQFYFDVNENGVFNKGTDYDLIGKYEAATLGATKKYYYSYQVLQMATEMGIYPPQTTYPYQATLAESKDYWYLRNTDHFIDSFMIHMPNLKVLFMVRDDSDHITSAKNHPEVIMTWNKFNSNSCNWFRVNSDKSYIEFITGTSLPLAPDNDANTPIDNMNIRNMVMPGNIFSNRYFNHYSSSLEMADRVMNNDWSLNLNGILGSTCPNTEKLEDETVELKEGNLYPNPAQNEVYIPLNAGDFGTSNLTVFNSIGQQVMQTQNDAVAKGFNLLILDINNLSSGNYFVRIDAPGVTRTLQFTRE